MGGESPPIFMLSFNEYLLLESTNKELKSLYDHFNRTLFKNSLPKNLKVRYGKYKNAVAVAKASAMPSKDARRYSKYDNRRYSKIDVTEIVVSNLYDLPEDFLKGILVHEMIHVEMYIKGIVYTTGDPSHGEEFKSRLKELRQKVPFEIPETEANPKFKKQSKEKFFNVVIMKTKSGIRMWVTNDGKLKKDKDNVLEVFGTMAKRMNADELLFLRSSLLELNNYKTTRSIKLGMGYYPIEPDLYTNIINNSTTVYTYK